MKAEDLYDLWIESNGKFKAGAPPLVQAILMIHTGQAIIDNGGFQYFFESDFPEKKHSDFVESYRLIGCEEHAQKLLYILSLFPDSQPHEDLQERSDFMQDRFDGEQFKDIDEIEDYFLTKSDDVYRMLDQLSQNL